MADIDDGSGRPRAAAARAPRQGGPQSIDPAAFIRARLPLAPVPGCPGLVLHTAEPSSGVGRLAAATAGGSPYWAYPWAGGLALARYLLDNPDRVADRHVLDFGAGSGLVAIAAAKAGAAEVFAADQDALARAAIVLNAEANGVRIAIQEGQVTEAPPGTEVVLAGDVFYARDVARRSLAMLGRFAAAGLEVLIGDPGRSFLPRERLAEIARYSVVDYGGANTTGFVFALRPLKG